MKRSFITLILALAAGFAVVCIVSADTGSVYVAQNADEQGSVEGWDEVASNYIEDLTFTVNVDGTEGTLGSDGIYLSSEGIFMFSQDTVEDFFRCAVNVYDESSVIVLRGSVVCEAQIGSSSVSADGETVEISTALVYTDGVLYIPEDFLTLCMGFEGSVDISSMSISYTVSDDDLNTLPSYYSSADYGRMPTVKDQGSFGACWAAAAASALEAALLPEEESELSVDHIMYNSGFGDQGTESGDQVMSMGYLLSWKGPVLEEDDPYGDGETDSTLDEVYHVQEIQYLESKDYEAIKEAIILYGAVETSMYIATIGNNFIDYKYYSYTNASYCCTDSTQVINHEVIIIGWDDDYPAENFRGNASSDGAFICLNSWGSGFGSDGIFYVSYEDAYIGTNCLAYTSVESADNYDNIYQYDDVGWTSNIGYDKSRAYMANVYTAASDELLEAVGFYTLGTDTEYAVYVIADYEDESSLSIEGQVYASGTLSNSGYYTIELAEAVELCAGQSFAVIVMVDTVGVGKPLACEQMTDDERTANVTVEGKLSYISSSGTSWECTQTSGHEANICLKAYTSNIE